MFGLKSHRNRGYMSAISRNYVFSLILVAVPTPVTTLKYCSLTFNTLYAIHSQRLKTATSYFRIAALQATKRTINYNISALLDEHDICNNIRVCQIRYGTNTVRNDTISKRSHRIPRLSDLAMHLTSSLIAHDRFC